jgi:hypothetical protein
MAHTVRAATKSQRSHDLSYFGSHCKIGRNDLTDDLQPEFCGFSDIFRVIFGSLFYIFFLFLKLTLIASPRGFLKYAPDLSSSGARAKYLHNGRADQLRQLGEQINQIPAIIPVG